MSESISTKPTWAPPAFSALTMARESLVGNSQSDVNEITQKPRRRMAERLGQHPVVVGREVEIIHRPRHVEVGIRIEPLDERHALMAQIALDLEIGVEGEGRRLAILEGAAELTVQRALGQVGDVRAHPGDGRAPFAAARPPPGSGPGASQGSAITACRPTSWKAMFWAEWRAPVAIGIAANTRSG